MRRCHQREGVGRGERLTRSAPDPIRTMRPIGQIPSQKNITESRAIGRTTALATMGDSGRITAVIKRSNAIVEMIRIAPKAPCRSTSSA